MQINYRVATHAFGDTWRLLKSSFQCVSWIPRTYTHVHANVDQAVAADIARDARQRALGLSWAIRWRCAGDRGYNSVLVSTVLSRIRTSIRRKRVLVNGATMRRCNLPRIIRHDTRGRYTTEWHYRPVYPANIWLNHEQCLIVHTRALANTCADAPERAQRVNETATLHRTSYGNPLIRSLGDYLGDHFTPEYSRRRCPLEPLRSFCWETRQRTSCRAVESSPKFARDATDEEKLILESFKCPAKTSGSLLLESDNYNIVNISFTSF